MNRVGLVRLGGKEEAGKRRERPEGEVIREMEEG